MNRALARVLDALRARRLAAMPAAGAELGNADPKRALPGEQPAGDPGVATRAEVRQPGPAGSAP
jgi:hypothetical protein